MAKSLDPSKVAQKWQSAMGSPQTQQAYKDGVAAVQVSPTQQAAQQLDRYLQGTSDAVNSGRMAARLNAVTLQQWQQQAQTIGAQRLSTGAQKGAAKYQAFTQKWAPVWQQQRAAAAALPKGGIANALARVQAVIMIAKQAANKAAN
jgi:hypothetical protein